MIEQAPERNRLKTPVLIYAVVTLLVFVLIYYVYGPCSSFARFSRPGESQNVATDLKATDASTATQAIDGGQSSGPNLDAARLWIAFPKKDVVVDTKLSPNLDLIARYLKQNRDAKLDIIGHTCNIGQHEDNDRLSLERAQAIQKYLLGQGIDRDRLTAIGRGEREPFASNSSDAGRIRNRRVDFRLSN